MIQDDKLFYSRKDIQTLLGCGYHKACKVFREIRKSMKQDDRFKDERLIPAHVVKAYFFE